MFLLELLLISIIHLAMIGLDVIGLLMIIRAPTVINCVRVAVALTAAAEYGQPRNQQTGGAEKP